MLGGVILCSQRAHEVEACLDYEATASSWPEKCDDYP